MTEREPRPERITPQVVCNRLTRLNNSGQQTEELLRGQKIAIEEAQGILHGVPSWTERSYVTTIGKGKRRVVITASDDPGDPYSHSLLSMTRGDGKKWDYFKNEGVPVWVHNTFVRLGINQ